MLSRALQSEKERSIGANLDDPRLRKTSGFPQIDLLVRRLPVFRLIISQDRLVEISTRTLPVVQ